MKATFIDTTGKTAVYENIPQSQINRWISMWSRANELHGHVAVIIKVEDE